MTNPIRTLEDTIAWAVARLGISRHDAKCDWSGGYDVNDCALFQSTAVFGEKAAWNVDVFTTLPGGTYHAGSAGIQRGDVLLYGWTPGHFDHTEMALGAPTGTTVKTIGVNGSDTIADAYRSRDTKWVTGYFRPNYLSQEDDMPSIEEIHNTVVGILRADEFKLGRNDRNSDLKANVLNSVIDKGTGTLAQTTRDTRVIARRFEVAAEAKLDALTNAVAQLAALKGGDPDAVTKIIQDAFANVAQTVATALTTDIAN